MGEYIIERLKELSEKYPLRNIRGRGLLIAFDLPDASGEKVVSACLDEGLILNSPRPATIRLMPPLTVMKQHVDDMLDILSRVLGKIY